MEDNEFEKLVAEGIDAIPAHIRALMENVAIVIADEPTMLQRKQNNVLPDEMLFGLYEGIPLTERGEGYNFVLPDKISIFKNPILETYSDPEEIKKCVSNTVWHEVAHHFGRDEEWVAAEEIKRGKTL